MTREEALTFAVIKDGKSELVDEDAFAGELQKCVDKTPFEPFTVGFKTLGGGGNS